MNEVRLDRWLWAARCFKTRALAATACRGGKVRVNGHGASAHKLVRTGDEVEIGAVTTGPRRRRVLLVRELAERRLSPTAAQALYEDRSPPPPPPAAKGTTPARTPGAGRPTKRDRRALERLREGARR